MKVIALEEYFVIPEVCMPGVQDLDPDAAVDLAPDE